MTLSVEQRRAEERARRAPPGPRRADVVPRAVHPLVSRYLQGMCGPLALALHERTGWPTVGVFDTHGGTWTDKPRHVACLSPDGLYADARGLGLDADALTEGYRIDVPLEVRPFRPDEIRLMYAARPAEDHELAAEHLQLLLPDLPPMPPDEPMNALAGPA